MTAITIMKIYWPISTCQAFTNGSIHIISFSNHKNPWHNGHAFYGGHSELEQFFHVLLAQKWQNQKKKKKVAKPGFELIESDSEDNLVS